MAYFFYMDGIPLPVAPSSLQMKIKNQNKTITLINEGEVNILKTPGLTEMKFDMRIPQRRVPFAVYDGGFKGGDYYLSKLEQWKTGKKAFQFIVSRTLPNGLPLFDTNIKVSLEEYQVEENAEEGFDVIIAVHLKQHRAYGIKTIVLTPPPTPQEPSVAQAVQERPVETAPVQKTYTVVRGDCLWNIAKKLLGKGARYTEIYNLNRDKIKTPNLIYPGQVLVLP